MKASNVGSAGSGGPGRPGEAGGEMFQGMTPKQAADLKKLSQAKAGYVVLEQAAAAQKQAQETREAAKEQESQKEQDERGRDRPQLTQKQAQEAYEAALAVKLAGKAVEKLKLALLEQLLSWEPKPGQSLSQNLAELYRLYQQIYQAILKESTGELQQLYFRQLKEGMLLAVQKILNQNLGQLEGFLTQYGEAGSLPSVLAALYRQAAGEALRPEDGRLLSGKGEEKSAPQSEGSLYRRSKEGIAMKDLVREAALSKGREPSFSQGGASLVRSRESLSVSEAIFRRALSRNISVGELAKTEGLAGYFLEKGGAPFKAADAGKAELLGFQMGMDRLKTEVFLQEQHIGRDLSQIVRDAAERMVQSRLMEAGVSQRGSADGTFPYREALAASQYVQQVYDQNRDPREALFLGYRAAYRRSMGRREGLPYVPYEKGMDPAGKEMGEEGRELKKGLLSLREEWNQFINSLRWENKRRLLLGSDFLRESFLAAEYLAGKSTGRKKAPVRTEGLPAKAALLLGAGLLLLAAGGMGGADPLLLLGGGILLAGALLSFVLGRKK